VISHADLRALVVTAEDATSEVQRLAYPVIRDSVHEASVAGLEREITDRTKKVAVLLDEVYSLILEAESEFNQLNDAVGIARVAW
jgi:hypothetical protein